jgi:hypothetical protein
MFCWYCKNRIEVIKIDYKLMGKFCEGFCTMFNAITSSSAFFIVLCPMLFSMWNKLLS